MYSFFFTFLGYYKRGLGKLFKSFCVENTTLFSELDTNNHLRVYVEHTQMVSELEIKNN